MAKREFLLNPLAVSVALTLGLVGCGGSDDPITITPPPPPVSKSQDVTFDVAVTGQAVKGTIRSAHVKVMGVDASGHEMAIPFRLASGTKTYSTGDKPAGTTDAQLQAVLDQMVLAENPSAGKTGDTGEFTVYLKHGYVGPVRVVVSTTKGDSSWMRCDSNDGCGTYDQVASPVLPNDGDLNVDFEEWYNDSVELSALTMVNAADVSANVSVYSHLVALNLLNNGAITQDAIANAGALVVQQLMFSALEEDGTAAMMADFAKADAIDLADLGDDSLSSGVLSLLTLSSSLQSSAADAEITLAELITQLSDSVNQGTFSDDAGASAVVAMAPAKVLAESSQLISLRKFLEKIAKRSGSIFVAVLLNDVATLENLNVKPGTIVKIQKQILRALKNGAIDATEITRIAAAITKALDKLGCVDDPATTDVNECSLTGAADAITNQIIKSVTSEVTRITGRNADNKAAIDALKAANDAAEAIKATSDSSIAAVIAYYKKAAYAYSLAFDISGTNVIGATALRTSNNAGLLVAAATALVNRKNDATTQGLLTSANNLRAAALTQSNLVNGGEATDYHNIASAAFTAAKNLLAAKKADARNDALQAVIEAVQNIKDVLDGDSSDLDMAKTKYMMVADHPATNYQEAVANDAMAKQAQADIAASLANFAAHDQTVSSNLDIVNTFVDVYSTDNDFADQADLAEQYANSFTKLFSIGEGFFAASAKADEVAKEAATRLAYFTNVEAAKAEAEKAANAHLITATGKQSFDFAIRMLGDILDEAVANGGTNTDFVDSAKMPGWMYKYNKENRTLQVKEMVNDQAMSFIDANIDFANANDKTTATLGWKGKIVAADNTMAEFMGSGSAGDCTAGTGWADNTCFAIEYTGTIDGIDGMKGGIEGKTYSNTHMKVTDADIVVTGVLSHMEEDVATNMKKGWGKFSGALGDWAFSLDVNFDDQADNVMVVFESGANGFGAGMSSTAGAMFSGVAVYSNQEVASVNEIKDTDGVSAIKFKFADETTAVYKWKRFVRFGSL